MLGAAAGSEGVYCIVADIDPLLQERDQDLVLFVRSLNEGADAAARLLQRLSELHAPVLRNGARPRVHAEPPVVLTGVSLAGLPMRRLVRRESLAAVEARLTHGASPPGLGQPRFGLTQG